MRKKEPIFTFFSQNDSFSKTLALKKFLLHFCILFELFKILIRA